MSGGKGKQTVGYRYYMGLHGGLCHGPVDALLEVRGGDVTLWAGGQSASGAITINAPNAYGGDDHEGGVVGTFDVMMGEPTQGANSYLTSIIGGLQSAFRGLMTFVARGAQIGSNNPYPKPLSFRVRRAKMGWDGGTAWYAAKAPVPYGDAVLGPWSSSPPYINEANITTVSGGGVAGTYTSFAGWVAAAQTATARDYSNVIGWQTDAATSPLNTLADYIGVSYTPLSSQTSLLLACSWKPLTVPIYVSKPIQYPGGAALDVTVCQDLIDQRGLGYGQYFYMQGYVNTGVVVLLPDTDPAPAGYDYILDTPVGGTMALSIGSTKGYMFFAKLVTATRAAGTNRAMNPSHIVYECLTNRDWGMGYPTTIIDAAAFTAAADQLYAEGFGLCLLWKRDDSIENFLQHIMDTVGAVLVQSKTTGLFQFNLIRGGYDIGTLPVFTADDVQIVSVDGGVLTGATNEITVNWFDPVRKEKRTTTLQSLGNIQSQGVVVSATKDYPGIMTAGLAARVAARDLRAVTVPLKRVELHVNRSAYALLPGGLFVLNFPDYEIESMVFRVGEVDYGTLEQGYITVTAVQDIFALPDTTYIVQPDTGWTPPSSTPQPAPYSAGMEVDYRSLYRKMTASDLSAIPADAGYAGMLNARPAGGINYQVWSRVSPATYAQNGESDFCPTATLQSAIGRLDTPIMLLAGIDLDNVQVPCAALIDDEIVALTTLDATSGAASIKRGCVDTVPAPHAAGARIWFFDDHVGSDAVQYTTGEAVDQKALTITSQGTLAIGAASAISVTIANRQSRPYPPGGVKIGGVAYPTTVTGGFTVTWAHRNKATQMDQLVDTTAVSVTPADNTRYALRFIDATDTLIVERTDIGPATATVSLNYTGDVTMELYTIDNVGQSTQKHSFTFAFTGTGTNTITATAYTPVDDSPIIDGGTI